MVMDPQLEVLLAQAAKTLKWEKFVIGPEIGHEAGDGFLGEFYMVSLVNQETCQKVDLAIKKAFRSEGRRKALHIPQAFQNEIYFYEVVVPKFKDVSFLPTFFGSNKNNLEESIVMENLKALNYEIAGKENLLNTEQVHLIFKTYGKFHAQSFALKDQNPEEYQKLTENIQDIIKLFNKTESFNKSRLSTCTKAFKAVRQEIQESCKQYLENPDEIFHKSSDYLGKYSCIVHGDCWSNNMMFKYQDSKLIDMKLFDFQLMKNDTPIHDLSYFLYSSTTKECYQNLDKLLEIYYQSFSESCRDLGSDPNLVFPFEALMDDWKEYSKWGLFMGLMVHSIRLYGGNQGLFEERGSEIIEHIYQRNFL